MFRDLGNSDLLSFLRYYVFEGLPASERDVMFRQIWYLSMIVESISVKTMRDRSCLLETENEILKLHLKSVKRSQQQTSNEGLQRK